MNYFKSNAKKIFKESIFGALFTLCTAPIDDPKLDISKAKESQKNSNNRLLNNMIIGQKSS